jgi:hypothetical protein
MGWMITRGSALLQSIIGMVCTAFRIKKLLFFLLRVTAHHMFSGRDIPHLRTICTSQFHLPLLAETRLETPGPEKCILGFVQRSTDLPKDSYMSFYGVVST